MNNCFLLRRRAFVLAAVVLMSLACMTADMGFKVLHQKDQEDRLSVTLSARLTDAYIEAARSANAELKADYAAVATDYAAAGVPLPDCSFAESMHGTGLDTDKLGTQGYQVVQDAHGFTASRDSTLKELTQSQTESTSKLLWVEQDELGNNRYIFDLEVGSEPTKTEKKDDPWAKIDQLRAKGLGPKPPLTVLLEPLAPKKKEKQYGLVDGLAAAFGDVAGMIVGGTKSECQTAMREWYGNRIFLKSGLPVFRLVVDLPGELVLHEIDGQTAGQVEGNRVTFVIDEAFMRQFGSGKHHFRVESLLNICQADVCSDHTHQMWDGKSLPGECACVCDPPSQWRMNDKGECEAVGGQSPVVPPLGPVVPPPGPVVPPAPGQGPTSVPTVSDLVRDLEKFLAGAGVKGTPPERAAAAGSAIATLIAIWTLFNAMRGVSEESLQKAAEAWRQGFRPPPERSRALPDADPQSVQALEKKFQQMVDQRIKEGCYVKNPDALKKAWNQTIGGLIKWAAGYTGGQCGEFAKWGREWSEQFVEKIFGKGAIVDTIWVGERSSRDIQTFEDWVDARYEANHAATRVILPTGESYVLDYWEAIKNKQSDPNAEVKLIPEGEWIEKWTKAIGETGDPAEVHNMNRSQRDLQSYIRACDTDEEAFEAFRKGKWSADAPLEATTPPQYVQTIINSWRKGGHRWEQINLDQE